MKKVCSVFLMMLLVSGMAFGEDEAVTTAQVATEKAVVGEASAVAAAPIVAETPAVTESSVVTEAPAVTEAAVPEVPKVEAPVISAAAEVTKEATGIVEAGIDRRQKRRETLLGGNEK